MGHVQIIDRLRVSSEAQDLAAQCDALTVLGVESKRIDVDQGFTGRNKNRAGLHEALAGCREGDTFVVTKLDRLAPSVREAHQIADDLANREIKLSIGGSVHDPTGPMGKLLSNVLAMISELEADHIRMRTREGMKVATAKARLRGDQPNPTVKQENHLLERHTAGEHAKAELFTIGRSTVYRTSERGQRGAAEPLRP
ncbi:recombinase [Arthrobacter livingstonensis]|uniref:Recombinase n=1 Tax=Arthrobacter livingstonensis TaxID=670078 RepID=A0A2V5LKL3_9MICC|nr:recombinase family protein [Arthrobacter livingstonensis]PYI67810.1 recombinase [Arthrobacter livingstonensis]